MTGTATDRPGLQDHVYSKGQKKRFLDAMAAANVAYSLCSTLDGAKELKKELAFLSAISAVLRKFDGVDKKRSAEQKHSAL
jgi:type I restriction enzyme R subunit